MKMLFVGGPWHGRIEDIDVSHTHPGWNVLDYNDEGGVISSTIRHYYWTRFQVGNRRLPVMVCGRDDVEQAFDALLDAAGLGDSTPPKPNGELAADKDRLDTDYDVHRNGAS